MSERMTTSESPTNDSTQVSSSPQLARSPRLAVLMAAITMAFGTACPGEGNLNDDYTVNCSDPNNAGRCDFDGDGFNGDEECDDFDANVHPGATEVPYNGIDENCTGSDLTDVDGDGFDGREADGSDCDDNDAEINPAAAEICDGADNDCDDGADDEDPQGAVDMQKFTLDLDGDSFGGNEWEFLYACAQPESITLDNGYAIDFTALLGDCNDQNNSVHPGAAEACNGVDDDCNGVVDDSPECP